VDGEECFFSTAIFRLASFDWLAGPGWDLFCGDGELNYGAWMDGR